MIKIEIKSIFGNVLFTYESEDNTIKETLRRAVLVWANLEWANLVWANLVWANLRRANLEWANLVWAVLEWAVLVWANLEWANLVWAVLEWANLVWANLRRANLECADLVWANLVWANLVWANLVWAVLEWAVLVWANLEWANLVWAVLEWANLVWANLVWAKNIPESYTKLCIKDMIYVMQACIQEVPYLRQSILEGRINGTQYNWECCCLIGSLSASKKISTDDLCSVIPYYDKWLHNYWEQWFYQIREGDTPENSYFSQKALEACDLVLSNNKL